MRSDTGVPCLSIRQPWADLIVDGLKDVENRSWKTDFRGIILVHASRVIDEGAIPPLLPRLHARTRAEYHPVTGAIIGYTTIVDCVTSHRSPFFSGPYGFVLEGSRRLDSPIPFAGRLGIFSVPARILRDHGCTLPLGLGPRRTSSWS